MLKDFSALKDFDETGDNYQYLLSVSYEDSLILCFQYQGISFWAVLGFSEGDKNKGKTYWMHQPLPASKKDGLEAIVINHLRPELERYREDNKLKILIKMEGI